jgi:hypothetical protein
MSAIVTGADEQPCFINKEEARRLKKPGYAVL